MVRYAAKVDLNKDAAEQPVLHVCNPATLATFC